MKPNDPLIGQNPHGETVLRGVRCLIIMRHEETERPPDRSKSPMGRPFWRGVRCFIMPKEAHWMSPLLSPIPFSQLAKKTRPFLLGLPGRPYEGSKICIATFVSWLCNKPKYYLFWFGKCTGVRGLKSSCPTFALLSPYKVVFVHVLWQLLRVIYQFRHPFVKLFVCGVEVFVS
jgi:hypothetical protein